jgi:fibronectin-binding autotransporter adhesin
MSKKLNHSFAIGIFLIGLLSANLSQAQTYTNLYWNPSALGGGGQWNATNVFWSTNSAGGGTLQSSGSTTSNIYNFSGTAGTVTSGSSLDVGGINWLTTGYNLSGTSTGFKYTGTITTNASGIGTNTVSIANNVNLNITGSGGTFDALGMTGGAGSTVTLTNAAGATTTVIFGTTGAKSGRTNSVNTIISGAGTVVLGSQGSSGFTQAGTIVNNSSGSFVITNSSTGFVNLNGAVSGTGGLSLNNSTNGKISLTASNNYSGGTTINNIGGGEIILVMLPHSEPEQSPRAGAAPTMFVLRSIISIWRMHK